MMGNDIQDFERDVIQRSFEIPVVVDFWAEWCGPCRILGPTLERLATSAGPRWALAKVNTEIFPEPAMQYGVQSIPTVKLFVDGEVISEFVGALPEDRIVKWLNGTLPSPLRHKIADAQALIAAERLDDARQMLRELLDAEPRNDHALILLATLDLFENHQRAAELVKQIPITSQYADTATALDTIASLLDAAEHSDELPEGKGKTAYAEALRHLRERRFEDALPEFISVVRRDRKYCDDGARKACIAIFTFLGATHELTVRFRPEFSSALYA